MHYLMLPRSAAFQSAKADFNLTGVTLCVELFCGYHLKQIIPQEVSATYVLWHSLLLIPFHID
jgi:hypothetical protein